MSNMFCTLSCVTGAMFLASAACAQTTPHAPRTTASINAVPREESSYQEKINMQVQTLVQQVSQLQKRVSDDEQTIAALQRRVAMNNGGPQLATVASVNDVSLKVLALQSDFSGLKSKFYGHTHNYSSTNVNFTNIDPADNGKFVSRITGVPITTSKTSTPN